MRSAVAALLFAALLAGAPAGAVEPGEVLDDPALESRARTISKDLRCVVCQNQSIDDSNAPLARDLRLLVRERLVAGDSDKAVIAHIVDRYGNYVLLRPPMEGSTYALWFGPAAFVLLAVLAVLAFYRRRAKAKAAAPLTPAEEARIARLLDDEDRP